MVSDSKSDQPKRPLRTRSGGRKSNEKTLPDPAWDVFISHASEDKETLVRPLADFLADLGVRVWYDEMTLRVGDSLSRSIDSGLARSTFGVVVLSHAFLAKPWPEYELRGLVTRDVGSGGVILPIWYGIHKEDLVRYSPPLADKFALDATGMTVFQIGLALLKVIRPDIHEDLTRLGLSIARGRSGEMVQMSADQLAKAVEASRSLGALRESLLPGQSVRIALIYHTLGNAIDMTFDNFRSGFLYDFAPEKEIRLWERIAVAFLRYKKLHRPTEDDEKRALQILVMLSMGQVVAEPAREDEVFSTLYALYVDDLD